MSDIYTVIKRPLITEKNTLLNSDNVYCFEVDKKANKIDIARAAKLLFNVEVVDVNTSALKKTRKSRKRSGARMSTSVAAKKAYVKLAEGHSIDFYGSN
jgi:large subunit ribosomal protein L23